MLQIGLLLNTIEKLCQLFLAPLQRFVSLKHIRKPFAGEQEVLRNPLLFYLKTAQNFFPIILYLGRAQYY